MVLITIMNSYGLSGKQTMHIKAVLLLQKCSVFEADPPSIIVELN